jgi:DNA topoisomerase-2
MFIKGTIKVSGRETREIVRDLRKLDFKPFPKVKKAVVAADPDASVIIEAMQAGSDDDDDMEEDAGAHAGALSDYDYLLDMSISTLTAAKVRVISILQNLVTADRSRSPRLANCWLNETRRRKS